MRQKQARICGLNGFLVLVTASLTLSYSQNMHYDKTEIPLRVVEPFAVLQDLIPRWRSAALGILCAGGVQIYGYVVLRCTNRTNGLNIPYPRLCCSLSICFGKSSRSAKSKSGAAPLCSIPLEALRYVSITPLLSSQAQMYSLQDRKGGPRRNIGVIEYWWDGCVT